MLGRLSYNISNGLTAGVNLSYDQAFETRFSADLKYRFGANGYGAPSIRKQQQPVVMMPIQSLSNVTPANRDVRVHDYCTPGFRGERCGVGEIIRWKHGECYLILSTKPFKYTRVGCTP